MRPASTVAPPNRQGTPSRWVSRALPHPISTSYTTEPMVHISCRTIDMHTPRCKPCAAEHVPHATQRRRPRMTIPPPPPPPRDRRQRHRTHERAHGLTLNRPQFGGLLGAAEIGRASGEGGRAGQGRGL